MAETFYADNFEEITGKQREAAPEGAVETKIVTPPEDTPIFNATEAETK